MNRTALPKLWIFISVAVFWISVAAAAERTIKLAPGEGDRTPELRAALEAARGKAMKLVLSKGTYRFFPDYASEKYCAITNHGNGLKKIVFRFEDFESVEIEGNGAELIFHGLALPFLFENCGRVIATDLTIDWDVPFLFQGEVLATNAEAGWVDLRPYSDGYSWSVKGDQLKFPGVDGFNYAKLGSTLAFDPALKRVAHGALDYESDPRWIEKRPGGALRFHEPLKQYPQIGSVLVSKGDRDQDRYAPAFHVKGSKNIRFERVTVHHALGMGFLMERSENATLSGCGVHLREGTSRLVSSTADATHFANCRGDILIENCRFENMLDDGTNVHGTYVEIDQRVDDRTVRVALKHFEQHGFEFAAPGDAVWFIQRPSPSRAFENEVAAVSVINDKYIELRFRDPLPDTLAKGDVLENKTWNPTFTMRGSSIRNHRARGIVLKTPKSILIEDNDFSSMMSAIFFRGETYFWFESGAVEDVLIRGNRFDHCAYGGMEHAILNITPRLGAAFDQAERYDRNIRFENNTIDTFDSRVVWADRVDGLTVSGNHITQTNAAPQLYPDAALFDVRNCRDVRIENNVYRGASSNPVQADAATRSTLAVEGNTGF